MLNFTLFGREFGQPDHEDPNQLKLFMRPQELMDTIRYSSDESVVDKSTRAEGDRDKTMSSLWSIKRSELYGRHYSGLVESIKNHGVLRPVTIEDRSGAPLTMGQGHHRVAAANMVEQNTGKPVFIPVVYGDDAHHSDSLKKFPMSLTEAQFRKNRPEIKR